MATGRLKCPFPYSSPVKMPTNTSERGSGAAAAWLIVMLIQTGLYSPRYGGIHNASGAPAGGNTPGRSALGAFIRF